MEKHLLCLAKTPCPWLGWPCLTVDSLPQELQEPADRCHHLGLVQIQKGDNLEAQLLQKKAQLKHIHDGSHEVGMMPVVVVAHQKRDLACSYGKH